MVFNLDRIIIIELIAFTPIILFGIFLIIGSIVSFFQSFRQRKY